MFPKILAHTSFSKVFIKIEVRASGPRSLSFLRTDCSGSYTALFKHWGIYWGFKGWWNIGLSPFTPEPTRRPQILSGSKLLFMLRQKKSFCTWQWFIIKRWLSFIVWPCSLGSFFKNVACQEYCFQSVEKKGRSKLKPSSRLWLLNSAFSSFLQG